MVREREVVCAVRLVCTICLDDHDVPVCKLLRVEQGEIDGWTRNLRHIDQCRVHWAWRPQEGERDATRAFCPKTSTIEFSQAGSALKVLGLGMWSRVTRRLTDGILTAYGSRITW